MAAVSVPVVMISPAASGSNCGWLARTVARCASARQGWSSALAPVPRSATLPSRLNVIPQSWIFPASPARSARGEGTGYVMLQENGWVMSNWMMMHELFHDGRHALGFPCH